MRESFIAIDAAWKHDFEVDPATGTIRFAAAEVSAGVWAFYRTVHKAALWVGNQRDGLLG